MAISTINPNSLGGVPAFSAYLSTQQFISSSTWTKVLFDTKVFDTNTNFASSRFTPTVAGYYQINTILRLNSSTTETIGGTAIYKNGSQYSINLTALSGTAWGVVGNPLSEVIYCNGSTDYIEIYAYITSGGSPYLDGASGIQYCRFSGSLVRSA